MRNYPYAPRCDAQDTLFGVKIEDPYRYLEDRDAPQTRALVKAENEYTQAYFDAQSGYDVHALEMELRRKEKLNVLQDIHEACGARCATRTVEGGLRENVTLDEAFRVTGVLMNDEMMGNRMHVYGGEPCPTHPGIYSFLAVKHGAPRCCVIVYDAQKKQVLAELDDVFGYSWSEDGEAIYYSSAVVDTANNRNVNRVHRFDWRKKELATTYTHEGNAVFIGVEPGPKGGCFFEVKVNYGDTLILHQDASGRVTRLSGGKGYYQYTGEANGRCYFSTDDGAPMGRVVSIRIDQAGQEGALCDAFEVALPERDASLESVAITREGILAVHSRDACSEMALYGFDGALKRPIELPDRFGAVGAPEVMHVSDQGRLFFRFQSFTRKPELLMLDTASWQLTCIDRQEERDTRDVEVSQCFLNARDGQRILVYLVHPKGLVKDGDTPVLMYGYGGYFNVLSPTPENLAGIDIVEWVRKGRIYAHCILRGGGEYGKAWHEAGMKLSKKNAFYDFIDIAEWLIAEGYTRPSRIVANGASNGGLLMAAVTTLRPDLFGTVIASVPHTDMIRFRGDDRGMMYITEYGDPQQDEETLRYMLSYSPYHNIRPGVLYPRLLVQTGENDNNVPPYHGKKFAVRLQHDADEAHPVLLTVLAHGSHNRGVGDEYYRTIAQMQVFIEIGLSEGARE